MLLKPAARPVGLWLLIMAALVVVQVVLGGVTRLTDSGLSITEWKPLLGAIPPTDDTEWAAAFAKYQQIPQFQQLKSHLTLDEFKVIYFWEWLHRLWGRLLGLAFVGPMIVFGRQRRLVGLWPRLLLVLTLGALQGVMGWVMVASGLQDLVYVSHLRLAAHFMLAMLVLAALIWFGLEQFSMPKAHADGTLTRRATWALMAAMVVQLTLGAFMAGLKAALAAPTWPTINGAWLPNVTTLWWNDPLAVHFAHRTLAYAVTVGAIGWWWASRKVLGTARHVTLSLVVMQTVLGITTTVRSVYRHELLPLGVLHQLVGVLLFIALLVSLFEAQAGKTELNVSSASPTSFSRRSRKSSSLP